MKIMSLKPCSLFGHLELILAYILIGVTFAPDSFAQNIQNPDQPPEGNEHLEQAGEEFSVEDRVVDSLQKIGDRLKNFSEIYNDLDYSRQIKEEIKSLNDNVSSLESEMKNISAAIEDSRPGPLSSILGLIFQIIAIVVGAVVAFMVVDSQAKTSWKQLAKTQSNAQKASDEQSRESWKQLLYSIASKEHLEQQRVELERGNRLRESKEVQSALRMGLEINLGVIADFSRIALEKISSVSNNPDKAYNSLYSLRIPEPHSGLWENLHSYTKVIGEAATLTVVSSHLYRIGAYGIETGRERLARELVLLSKTPSDNAPEKRASVIAQIDEFKAELGGHFQSILDVCEIATNALDG